MELESKVSLCECFFPAFEATPAREDEKQKYELVVDVCWKESEVFSM